MVDLMLLTNDDKEGDKQEHYCWVKSLSRLLKLQVSSNSHELFFCRRCFNHFTRQDILDDHLDYCSQNEAVKIELPEPGTFTQFDSYNRAMRVPFAIYADFECFVEKIYTCQPNSSKPYTKQYQHHEPSGYCYYVKYEHGQYKSPVLYQGPDVAKKFVREMEKEMWAIYNIYQDKKDMVMTEEDKKRHESSMTCHICSKELDGDTVRDHDHITGRYRGAAHNECNLAFQLPKFIPIVFHNLSGYDAHLFVKELGFNGGQINCIPNTDEKYISFAKKVGSMEMRFIDSCRFMPNSLDTLVKNLTKDQFKNTREVFSKCSLDPELYRVIPAKSENERKITLREVIDARKLEYIVSHPDDFQLGSRHINGKKIDKNGQLTLLKNYLGQVNGKGERLMNYYQLNKFGRYWTEGDIGIQNMSRKIRHTLCQDFMYDIDMKNAHPTLLSWYCHDNGINCTGLDAYIANREEYMADWMMRTGNTRDEVKAHLLAIINGRKVKLESKDPKWY